MLRAIGYIVLGGSVVLVVSRLHAQVAGLSVLLSGDFVALLLVCALAYAVSLQGLSVAWYRLLQWLGPAPGSIAQWHGVYGRTSIARYLPGNVFHFAGRHVMGRRLGAGDALLAVAAVYELLGLAGAATLIATLGVVLWPTQGWPFGSLASWVIAGTVLAGILALARLLPALLARFGMKGANLVEGRSVVGGFGPCLLLYVGFIGTSSAIACAIAIWLGKGPTPWIALPAYAIAWLVGFAVPGASGGLGVREAVFLLLLEQSVASSVGLQVAVSTRVVTTLGDLLFFLASFAWPTPSAARAEGSGLPNVDDEGR